MFKSKITPASLAQEHKLKEAENKLILNYLTIRKIVGWLGILLPVILILSSFFYPNCDTVQPSISDYHNTISRDIFVGLLCAISLFLFSYKGYTLLDSWIANITGILGFMIAFFPTYIKLNSCSIYPESIKWQHGDYWPYADWVTTVHLSSASIFLLLLGYYSFFLFTRSDKEIDGRGTRKKRRNRFYRTCGVIIVICVILLAIYVFKFENDSRDYKYYPIIILECIALWAFGFSWLVKGKTLGVLSFFQDLHE